MHWTPLNYGRRDLFHKYSVMSSSENGSVSPNLSRAGQPEPSWSSLLFTKSPEKILEAGLTGWPWVSRSVWFHVCSPFCKLDWRSQSSLCHPDCPQKDLKALVDTLAAPWSASRWEDGATAERGAIPRIAGRSPPLVWWSPIAVNHHSQESSPSRSQFQKFLSDIRHQVCISPKSRFSTNPMHSSIHHYHHRSWGRNDPTIPWGKS